MATNNTPKWKTFLDFFGYFQSIKILWGIFLGLLAAIGVVLKMPASPLTYLIAAAAFTGTWIITGTLIWVGAKSVPVVKRWKSPHSLAVDLMGGNNAVIEIRHRGEKATWEVRRKIVKVIDSSANPDPVWRLCTLRKDGRHVNNSPLARW